MRPNVAITVATPIPGSGHSWQIALRKWCLANVQTWHTVAQGAEHRLSDSKGSESDSPGSSPHCIQGPLWPVAHSKPPPPPSHAV
eukprot:972131-Prymnesium_polylepis.3